MRRPLKIILSILASLVVLGVITLATLPFAIDVNDFKAQIEAAVQENTGRRLIIDGKVELSFFPWLGITTEKMILNNAEGFKNQTFAQISEGQIKVKLVPLLFKQVEVSEIVLKGLHLNLLKDSQGKSNWDDLIALIQNKQDQTKNPLKLLEIAGVLIKNAHISWENQQTGKKITLKDFNLATDKLSFNKPVPIAFDFAADNVQPVLTQTVKFAGNLMINEDLDLFELQKISLKTQTEGKIIPTGTLVSTLEGNASFDLKQQILKLAPLSLKTGALTISSPNLTAWLQEPVKLEGSIHIPNFDAAGFMQQNLAVQLPQMADEKALAWLAADFYLSADANQAKLQNLVIQLDETTLKGAAQINNFADPGINFNLALDTVNFDRYLPPDNNAQDSSSLPMGSALAKNTTLFPLELLRKLNLNGQLTIADLKIKNLTMQGVRLRFNAKNGFIQSQQSVNRLYQGAYNSKVLFDVNSAVPVLTLTQQLSHIQIERLLTDLNGQSQFAGLIDLNAKLEATGNSCFALKSSLNGRLSFLGKDLLIRGFNLQKIIDNGKIWLSSTSLSSDSKKDFTAFSIATGTGIISNGLLRNNDLSAIASKTKVGGLGVINLVSQQLDYKVIAILLKEKMTTTHAKVINSLPVFINIGGTFNAPTYQVDLAAMGVGL